MMTGTKRVFPLMGLVLALTGFADGGALAETNAVTLARHETVAEFRGTNYHRCMGLTSLCPEQCGHSGTLASFKIINYMTYEKLGEYGDPKCDQLEFLVEDNTKHLKVPAAIQSAVYSLTRGDLVLLSWNHDYVTVNGGSGPERPVTRLERIGTVGTATWLNQIDSCARVRDAEGHAPTVGSDEWKQAVSVKLGVYDSSGHGPTPDSDEWRIAVHRKAFGVEPAKPEGSVDRR